MINCIELLKEAVLTCDNDDQELGVRIVTKALYAPFMTILINAGIENAYEILSSVKSYSQDEDNSIWYGYNAKTGEIQDFFAAGILDPTKVTRTAIENAASVAGTILTTESVVYFAGDEKKEDIDYSQFMQ
jgi:chaperonin GroEL